MHYFWLTQNIYFDETWKFSFDISFTRVWRVWAAGKTPDITKGWRVAVHWHKCFCVTNFDDPSVCLPQSRLVDRGACGHRQVLTNMQKISSDAKKCQHLICSSSNSWFFRSRIPGGASAVKWWTQVDHAYLERQDHHKCQDLRQSYLCVAINCTYTWVQLLVWQTCKRFEPYLKCSRRRRQRGLQSKKMVHLKKDLWPL